MRIITLSCTQKRQPSLTDGVLSAATQGFLSEEPSAEIVSIRLIDHDIQLCEGEDTCLDPSVGHCTLVDDFDDIATRAANANGMILAMPVYGGNVPAILKMFQERLKSFMRQPTRPFGGLSVCTIVHARTMMTESGLGALAPWYSRLQMKNVVSVCFTQVEGSDVANSKVPDLCFAAGQQLALSMNSGSLNVRPRSPLMPPTSRPRIACGGGSAS